MDANLPNPLPSLDDAITAVKNAEGVLKSARDAKSGADAQLSAAQSAEANAQSQLDGANSGYKDTLDVLIAVAQAEEAALVPPTPAV